MFKIIRHPMPEPCGLLINGELVGELIIMSASIIPDDDTKRHIIAGSAYFPRYGGRPIKPFTRAQLESLGDNFYGLQDAFSFEYVSIEHFMMQCKIHWIDHKTYRITKFMVLNDDQENIMTFVMELGD